MNAGQLDAFCAKRRLPREFRRVIADHYQPLVHWLLNSAHESPPVIGISGAQGTGKSTLAEFLRLALKAEAGWAVALLSMDDFYLSRARRRALSREVHPLLATRGPPGTHDPSLMRRYLQRLKDLRPGASLALPRFDKARDDRAARDAWPTIAGPTDAIILEGWCLGIPPQESRELLAPVNDLEARRDPDGRWRNHVNSRLKGDYARLFSLLDRLIFLQAPDMGAVVRWRLEQENKLAARAPPGTPGIMNETELTEFVRHYERLTRAGIGKLPAIADVTLVLDSTHGVVESRYRR